MKVKRSKTYTAWVNMRTRCNRVSGADYANYGGRGIKVCEEWNNSFAAFLKDMGESPPGYQLDRIDNDKGYCKANCRWISKEENSYNRRKTRWLEHGGKKLPLGLWSKETGISVPLIIYRLKSGWTIEQALTEPATYGRKLKR